MNPISNACLKAEEIRRRIARGISVDESEIALSNAHIVQCSVCRRDIAITRAFAADEPMIERDETDRQRLIAAIVDLADEAPISDEPVDNASRPFSLRRSVWWGVAAVCAAACAAAILVVFDRANDHSPKQTESAGASTSSEPRAGREAAATTEKTKHWRTFERPTTVQLSEGIAVLLEADSTAFLERGDGTEVILRLVRGAVTASVDPNRKNKAAFSVAAKLGTVTVKGTVFRVSVSDEGQITEVLRGVVRAARKNGAEMDVTEGERFSFVDGSIFRISDTQTAALRASLDTITRSFPQEAPPSPEEDALSDTTALNSPTLFKHAAAKMRTPQPKTVSELLSEAAELRRNGDFSGAAERYATLIQKYPKSEEATATRVTLGQLQLNSLGDPRAALSNFDRYLHSNNRTLRQEALLGRAESLRHLGRTDEEREALERFVSEFPDSLKTEGAKNRLAILKK